MDSTKDEKEKAIEEAMIKRILDDLNPYCTRAMYELGRVEGSENFWVGNRFSRARDGNCYENLEILFIETKNDQMVSYKMIAMTTDYAPFRILWAKMDEDDPNQVLVMIHWIGNGAPWEKKEDYIRAVKIK